MAPRILGFSTVNLEGKFQEMFVFPSPHSDECSGRSNVKPLKIRATPHERTLSGPRFFQNNQTQLGTLSANHRGPRNCILISGPVPCPWEEMGSGVGGNNRIGCSGFCSSQRISIIVEYHSGCDVGEDWWPVIATRHAPRWTAYEPLTPRFPYVRLSCPQQNHGIARRP